MVCLKLTYQIFLINVFEINVSLTAVDVFLPMAVQLKSDPKAVKLRQEFGHFEVDTMQSGKVRGDVLVTITERLSRQHIVRHHRDCNSQALTPAIIRLLKDIENAKSITVDHGREFAKYDEIDEKLRIPVYFAHPYSPKERKIKKISRKELD